eukprot:TRINITY_DN20745_c0_g1_i8.p1 TRINITY_DN20745_c0_g1~~TRINITY_DN20745_c0_g1_i8.p1  ORF type:complete len:459 (+),score=154.65 TRINITY_DN20745_c0_g1_i8:251-1627(+)
MNTENDANQPPLWSLLRSQGLEVSRETDPVLDPPNNKPVGHATHNLLVKDKKSKQVYMLVNAQSNSCDLKAVAKTLGAKELRMADRKEVGVDAGCITALSLALAPTSGEGKITAVIDEALLDAKTPLVLCAGCADPLDHSQHNVCALSAEKLLQLLRDVNTPLLSLQSGNQLEVAADAAKGEGDAEADAAREAKEAMEEQSFLQKQLGEATAQIKRIEANDKSVTVYDFAHKVPYLKQHGAPMFTRLLAALPSNRFLTTVYLGCNDLGDTGAVQVAEALTGTQTLLHLYIQYNNIGDDGLGALCGLLGEGSVLKSLYVYGNSITCVGAKRLGEALGNNKALQKLHISQNYIGQDGGVALVEGLGENSTLEVLSLSMNPVGDATAASLATLLNGQSQLQFVTLSGCRVTDEGATALGDAIEGGCAIQTLDLSASQNVGPAVRERLAALAETKRIRIATN